MGYRQLTCQRLSGTNLDTENKLRPEMLHKTELNHFKQGWGRKRNFHNGENTESGQRTKE